QLACRLLHDAVARIALGALGVLGGGQAEEQDGAHAEIAQFGRLACELVDGELVLPGHRGDLGAHVGAVRHEERVDEHRRVEARLPHEAAQCVRATCPPGAGEVSIASDGDHQRLPGGAYSASLVPRRVLKYDRSSLTRPSIVCTAALTWTGRPAARAVS